jgi:hypothetical protein
LLDDCGEDRLLLLLDRLRLTALVGGRILQLAGADRFPRLADAVAEVASRTHLVGTIQAVVQRAVLQRLTQGGIAGAPLKGPDLALRVHGDLGLRPCMDVDVLVDAERLADAVAIVRTLGYGEPPPRDAPWFGELHDRLDHPALTMPAVEVHWRAEWYSKDARAGGLARLALERSTPDARGRGRELLPADELALLLLVYARDSMVGLRLPADVAAWWDRYGSAVPDGALQEIVDADSPLVLPLATSALACQRLVGLPVGRLLALEPARGARGRLAARLADPFLDEPPAHRSSALVDGLLSSRGAVLPFLRRRVLLPAGHIALRYGGPEGPGSSARVRLLQIQHPFRQLAYFAWFVAFPPPRPPGTAV